jgi:phosphohistidine swiveling domain-containing protein
LPSYISLGGGSAKLPVWLRAFVEIKELQKRIASCMSSEDRQDSEFRHAVFASQAGDLARYISHDPKLSPSARRHGSPAEERLSYGHAFVQLAGLAHSRGIDLDAAVLEAITAVEDRDWARRKAAATGIAGKTAHPGVAEGSVFVLDSPNRVSEIPAGSVLVLRYGGPELACVLDKVSAIVTDDGGAYSHLAVLARESGIPCIMGTGNATSCLSTGQFVRVNARESRGSVELLDARR